MANKTKIKWKDANIKWDDAKSEQDAYNDEFGQFEFTWNDVVLIEEIIDAVVGEGAGGSVQSYVEKAEEEKKKRLIRLVMRRRGIKMYDEQKEVKNITAHVKDIEMIVEEVKKSIQFENINV